MRTQRQIRREENRSQNKRIAKMLREKPDAFAPVDRIEHEAPPWMTRVFANRRYTVMINDHAETTHGPAICAMVQRHDNAPFRFHWADMQNVKNSIFGEEAWAVEYYPAAEQLVDQHNIYWMWIFPEGVLPLPTNPRAIPQTTPPDGEQQDRVV